MDIHHVGYHFSSLDNFISPNTSLQLRSELRGIDDDHDLSYFCSNSEYKDFTVGYNKHLVRRLSSAYVDKMSINSSIFVDDLEYSSPDDTLRDWKFPIDKKINIGKFDYVGGSDTIVAPCAMLDVNHDVVMTHIGFHIDFSHTDNDNDNLITLPNGTTIKKSGSSKGNIKFKILHKPTGASDYTDYSTYVHNLYPPFYPAEPEPEAEPEQEPEAEPEQEPEAEPESEPEGEPESEPEGEPESEPESEPEAESEPESEPEQEPESEPEGEPEQEPESEPESEPEAESEPESEPEQEPESEPESEPEQEPESEPESEPEAESEPESEPEQEPESEPESEPEMEPEPEPPFVISGLGKHIVPQHINVLSLDDTDDWSDDGIWNFIWSVDLYNNPDNADLPDNFPEWQQSTDGNPGIVDIEFGLFDWGNQRLTNINMNTYLYNDSNTWYSQSLTLDSNNKPLINGSFKTIDWYNWSSPSKTTYSSFGDYEPDATNYVPTKGGTTDSEITIYYEPLVDYAVLDGSPHWETNGYVKLNLDSSLGANGTYQIKNDVVIASKSWGGFFSLVSTNNRWLELADRFIAQLNTSETGLGDKFNIRTQCNKLIITPTSSLDLVEFKKYTFIYYFHNNTNEGSTSVHYPITQPLQFRGNNLLLRTTNSVFTDTSSTSVSVNINRKDEYLNDLLTKGRFFSGSGTHTYPDGTTFSYNTNPAVTTPDGTTYNLAYLFISNLSRCKR